MLKTLIVAGATAIAVPAVAQTATPAPTTGGAPQTAPRTTPQTTPQTTPMSPSMTGPTTPSPTPTPSATPRSTQQTPTDRAMQPRPGDTVDPAGTPQGTAADETAATQPAGKDQIASIVDAEFPKYDKANKGSLSQAQFGEWMLALRQASEPTITAASPEMKTWVGQAFAQADADKSKSVTKSELTRFLSQGA